MENVLKNKVTELVNSEIEKFTWIDEKISALEARKAALEVEIGTYGSSFDLDVVESTSAAQTALSQVSTALSNAEAERVRISTELEATAYDTTNKALNEMVVATNDYYKPQVEELYSTLGKVRAIMRELLAAEDAISAEVHQGIRRLAEYMPNERSHAMLAGRATWSNVHIHREAIDYKFDKMLVEEAGKK